MLNRELSYEYNGHIYPVIITYKMMRNITYRFRKDKILISASYFSSDKDIFEGLEKFAPRLIEKKEKINPPIGEDYIYLLGEKYDLSPCGDITFAETTIFYKDKEDLQKKLKKWFLKYITGRVRHYQQIMGVEEYRVRVQNMTSRFGSNSRHTKTLNFATSLIAYSEEIIDSVVVHELAHEVVYDHSKRFYEVLYAYFPQYDICRKKLRKGVYQ